MLTVLALFLAANTAAAEAPTFDAGNLPPRTLLVRPAARPVPDWLKQNLRIAHLPGYNERMVKSMLAAGYNVVTVNCLGTWDRVGPSAGMYADDEVRRANDYLRLVVDTIHAAGARCVFYVGPVQVPMLSPEFKKTHPDWLRVKPDGSRDENFGNIRSPYADWLCEQLAYVVEEYGVDGFWFDGYAPVHLHTYDDATRAAFREFSGGAEIPKAFDPAGDPVSRTYLAWHEQHFIDLADRMRGAIRAKNQEATIWVNYSANRTWYFPNMYMGEYAAAYCGAIDVSSVELYWDVPGDALYQQFCYAFMQDVVREQGGTVWIQPSAHGISGVASPIDLALRGLEGAPWGVYPEFVESTGREEYLKTHHANIAPREPFWIESAPVPYIGVVVSEQTRTLYAQGALPAYFSHALGAFRAIFESHLPVRLLNEYDLEDADLKGVRVLVMPNVACLSERAAEVVRRFVAAGGGLVASYETSLYDENFARRDDFALADVLHANYVKSHAVNLRTENLYLSLVGKHPIIDDDAIRAKQANAWLGGTAEPPENGPLALIASAAEVAPREGAETVATYRLNRPDEAGRERPAIVTSTFGQGRVAYLPASFDKGMFFYPDGYMRKILANACRWAAQEAPVFETRGPLLLAATYRKQPQKSRYVVHLLNDHSSYGRHSIYQKLAPLPKELEEKFGFPNQSELRGTWPVREEIIPLHDIEIVCRIPGITRATLEPEHIDLPLVPIPDGVKVIVPKLEMHSMAVFE